MKISYAIPVCNEYKEIEYLLQYLNKHKREEDEIVIQCDQGNTSPEVYRVLQELSEFNNISYKLIEFPLNNNFAAFKNNLKDNCSGDYIFQIDADEYPEEYLMSTIGWFIENNPNTDIFWVPRINKVNGLTQAHIDKWKWNVDPKGRINFPDYQCRIFKNTPDIKWKNKVHEVLTGYKTESYIPSNEEFCIYHLKDIERQEKQNAYYDTLMNKYSIISVVNNSYAKFAYVFVKSALDNLNLDHLHEICLLDTGLHEKDSNKLKSLNSKIKIIKNQQRHNSYKSWDNGWQENVLLKTNFAYNYIKENKITTCMIDIDSMFTNDLYDIILSEGDVVLCDRSELWATMPFIASFVGFLNPNTSISFIEEWREKMKTMLSKGFPTRETPALNELVKSSNKYKLLGASHRVVGLYKQDLETNNTRIIHFKGAGDTEEIPMDKVVNIRLSRFKKYSKVIENYLADV